MKITDVRTRFAPSPTGPLHVGSARTALFNFLFARHEGGSFIVRIEDTDRERSKPEFEKDIRDSLSWLGLEADESFVQSERKETHKKFLSELLEKNLAYVSEEKETEEGKRGDVIRFRNPGTNIVFNDVIRGTISMDPSDLGDFVIAKDLESPLYHFAVVVDDAESRISHVIRGEDMISNTPRQILIQEALGFPRPVYAHIPLILAPDRTKLSKRHGAVSLDEYRNLGYLREALINYLALLGWNPGDNREIFSLQELIKEFSLERIQRSGAVFDIEKLNWMNKYYIAKSFDLKNHPPQKFAEALESYMDANLVRLQNEHRETFQKILPLIQERIHTLGEVRELGESGEFEYFFKAPSPSQDLLLQKGETDIDATQSHLKKITTLLEKLSEDDFENPERIKNALWGYATEAGRGSVLWPFRVALSGREKSADPFFIASVLGKKETLERIRSTLQ